MICEGRKPCVAALSTGKQREKGQLPAEKVASELGSCDRKEGGFTPEPRARNGKLGEGVPEPAKAVEKERILKR